MLTVEIERLQEALKKIAYTPAFRSQAEIEAYVTRVLEGETAITNKDHCVMCDVVIDLDVDDYVVDESLLSYWCKACSLEDENKTISEQLDRTELAEAKARMENERLRNDLIHLRELWRYGTPQEVYDNLPRIAQMILDNEEGAWIG